MISKQRKEKLDGRHTPDTSERKEKNVQNLANFCKKQPRKTSTSSIQHMKKNKVYFQIFCTMYIK